MGLEDDLDEAPAIVRHLRSRGFRDEANILARAMDVASAALVGEDEARQHALINLSDLVCEALDEERENDGRESLN